MRREALMVIYVQCEFCVQDEAVWLLIQLPRKHDIYKDTDIKLSRLVYLKRN
jgi:hypothetical protein